MRTATIVIGIVLIFFVLVGSIVLQVTGGSPRAQVDQGQVWEAPLLSGEVETLKLMDFTGDGQAEIFAQTPNLAALISGDGQILFNQTGSNLKSTMGDWDGNGVEDFALAQPSGTGVEVVAYTGDGAQLWQNTISDVGAPARGLSIDFERDRAREVVFGTNLGVLVCLDGATGGLRWTYRFPPDSQENLLVRGTDDAWLGGRVNLVAADYGGHMVMLDRSGAPVWEKDFPEPIRRLRAYDMDGDGTSEILAGGLNGLVWLFSAAGDAPLWEASIGSRVDEARFLELDGDPAQIEVVVGGKNGGVSAFRRDGAVLWKRVLGDKVRELIVLDYDDDGENEVLVAADRVYLLAGRTGDRLSTFPVSGASVLDGGVFGGTRGYLAGTGQGVSAFRVSYSPRPWWSSPISVGLVIALFLAALTVGLARVNWEQRTVYTVQDKSLATLKAQKKMLREVIEDTEQVYRRGEIDADIYLARSRQERERLAAVEAQILELEPGYQPEVIRCGACSAPLEVGLDRCPYCNHVLL